MKLAVRAMNRRLREVTHGSVFLLRERLLYATLGTLLSGINHMVLKGSYVYV